MVANEAHGHPAAAATRRIMGLMVVVLIVYGCGEDGEELSPAEEEALCDAAEEIRVLNSQAVALMREQIQYAFTPGGRDDEEFLAVSAEMAALVPDMRKATDQMHGLADTDQQEDLAILGEIWPGSLEYLSGFDSGDDFYAATVEGDGPQYDPTPAVDAAQGLEPFLQDACGFDFDIGQPLDQ